MAEIPTDIPGNSRKTQASAQQSDKPPIPVFDGPTAGVKRQEKHVLWKWFKRMFLSDRKPKDILKEIVEQRVVPGIKDNVRNSAMATIDSFIYPGSGAAPVSTQNNVSYNRIYSSSPATHAVSNPQPQTKDEEIQKGFSNPCFKWRNARVLPNGKREQGADEFLALLKSYDYPNISVHTMYMMQGKHIDYTWEAYGWNREEILALGPGSIRTTGNADWPYMIVMPEAHPIQ